MLEYTWCEQFDVHRLRCYNLSFHARGRVALSEQSLGRHRPFWQKEISGRTNQKNTWDDTNEIEETSAAAANISLFFSGSTVVPRLMHAVQHQSTRKARQTADGDVRVLRPRQFGRHVGIAVKLTVTQRCPFFYHAMFFFLNPFCSFCLAGGSKVTRPQDHRSISEAVINLDRVRRLASMKRNESRGFRVKVFDKS